jgi:hypothetical protein
MEQALEATLDCSQLRQEEKASWRLQLDVYVLDTDGSLLDSCLLAAVAALLALRLPRAEQTIGDSSQPEQYLRMGSLPLPCTFATVGDHLLADPTAEEEAQAMSLMSVTTDARGSLTGAHMLHAFIHLLASWKQSGLQVVHMHCPVPVQVFTSQGVLQPPVLPSCRSARHWHARGTESLLYCWKRLCRQRNVSTHH